MAHRSRNCIQCNSQFIPDPRRDAKFCSITCAKAWTRIAPCNTCGQDVVLRGVGRSAKSRLERRECRKCLAKRWRKETPKGRACAGKCEHRKRCRKHGVRYDSSVKPAKVFERDNYVCHVCKRKTLKSFRWNDGKPDHRSPTIDHYPYPLSAGVCGHEWHNVRCCCWGCNTKKGARWSRQLPIRQCLPGA